jgi:hypothetical protein
MRPPPAVLDPLIVGALAAAVSLSGAARPSFWYDEAATISASYSRSLGQLWQMLKSSRRRSSGPACQAVWRSEAQRRESSCWASSSRLALSR